MIIIIGLQQVLNVFNLNAIKLGKEIGVNSRTVYDWLQEKRKIPKERVDQLSQMPQFKYVDKEIFQKTINSVDEIDIEIARAKYLSDTKSIEVEDDFYGLPVTHDPYGEEIPMLLELRDIEQEIVRAKSFVFDTNNLEGLNSSIRENYLSALTSLNDLFQQNDANKIRNMVVLLSLLSNKRSTDKLVEDLTQLLKKHINASGEDYNVYGI
ncbi:hypothetical protein [Priestia megaterium]|uniref:hypothetical protein n=1 Tax=Priestia megaterium TaxID=1404 RepID=UPI003EE8925A